MQSTNLPPSFIGQLSCSRCTCLSQYYTGRYPACFGGEPPRGIPSFFFVLYVATIRAGGYAKTSIQRPATAMSAHNKMHASTGGWSLKLIYPVGTSMCQPAHVPVGTIPCTPGRDENLLKPGRDFWGRPTGTITIRQLYSRPGLSSSEQRNPTGFISSRSRPYFPLFPCRSPALPVRHQLDRCAGHTLLDTEIPELALFRILPCVHIKSRSGFLRYRSVLFSLVFLPRPGL